MPKLKIWDKNARKEVEEREIATSQVHGVGRYTHRHPSDQPFDGCAVTLKNEKGGPGERLLSNENYSEVCRRFGITAEGASTAPARPAGAPPSPPAPGPPPVG